jgi:hypothetical protein
MNKDGDEDDKVEDDDVDEASSNDNKNSNIPKKDNEDACLPTSNNKKRKYNPPIVSPGILKSGNEDEVKNTTDDELFPIVLRAYGGEDGFDGTNPSVKKWMHKLLSELNSLLSTG